MRDVSPVSRQLALEREIVPSPVAVKRRAVGDDDNAFSNDRLRCIGEDKVDGIFSKLAIDLNYRLEIAQLFEPRLRLQTFQRFNGLAIARLSQFLRREDNQRLRPGIRAPFGLLGC